jgi:hypothetical protein
MSSASEDEIEDAEDDKEADQEDDGDGPTEKTQHALIL